MLATTVLAATTILGALWLDRNPIAFIYLYPLASVLGAIGIWQFSKIRVRGEGKALRHAERDRQPVYTPRPEELAQTDETNVMNYQPGADDNPSRRRGLRGFIDESMQILREDKPFRAYQWWQFFNGASFLLMNAPLMFMVSREMTNAATQYALATIVLQLVPMVTTIVFTQIWAPLFDRVHVAVFRVSQGFVSVIALSAILTGAVTNQLWLVAIAQFLVGISNAAGNLAWNLGQYDFAPPDKTAAYMGVHVMLTGVRGSFAPFIGVALYTLLGRWVFALSVAMSVVSLVGFMSMARKAPKRMPQARVKQMKQATAT